MIAQGAAAYLSMLDLLGFSRLAPIEFNPNTRLRARKVQPVGSDRVLASDREAAKLPGPEVAPEQPLGVGPVPSEPTA